MSNKNTDLIAEWQKLVRQAEGQINAMSSGIAGGPEFSRLMNEAMQLSFFAQASFGEQMEKMLSAMRMPTDSQMGDIIERLDRLEEKVDRLSSGLSTGSDRAELPRTRRPSAKG